MVSDSEDESVMKKEGRGRPRKPKLETNDNPYKKQYVTTSRRTLNAKINSDTRQQEQMKTFAVINFVFSNIFLTKTTKIVGMHERKKKI